MTADKSETGARERILSVATALFAERGYGSTSVRDITDAAGVTKPTLYYHFGNKEGLFRDAVRAALEHYTALTTEAVSGPGSVRERMWRFVHAAIKSGRTDPALVRLLLTAEHPTADQPELDLVSRHMELMGALVHLLEAGQASGEVRADIAPMATVMSLLGIVHIHILACLDPSPPSFSPQLSAEGAADHVTTLILDGVSP